MLAKQVDGNGVDVMMDTIYALELGHVLGYTLDGGNWYNGSTLVTGVQAKISHHTINELKSDVHSIIDEWTIGDVISNISPDNHILYALKDTQLDDLSVAISTMKLGTVMGYTHDGTKWTENGVEVTDAFARLLADYTVEQIGSDGFAEGLLSRVKDELTIGEFIAYDPLRKDPLSIIYSEAEFGSVTLSEMLTNGSGNSIGEKIKVLKVGDMISLGVVEIGDEYITKLNAAPAFAGWETMTFSEFFGKLLAAAFN